LNNFDVKRILIKRKVLEPPITPPGYKNGGHLAPALINTSLVILKFDLY
jgi:hypothetical protein